MMGKKQSLSTETKEKIKKMFEEGERQANIALLLNICQPSVSNVVNEARNNGYLSAHKKGAGRPLVTNSRSHRRLSRILDENRFVTVSQCRESMEECGIKISRSTVHRRMKEIGFKSRVPKKKPMLNIKQRVKRLKWAKNHISLSDNYWNQVIFSDESKFEIPAGRKGRVWRKDGEAFSPKCTHRTVKHPGGVMVWGSISSKGLGKLLFIDGNIDSVKYQEILAEGLLGSLSSAVLEQPPIFQHDLASCHNSKSTRLWMNAHNIEVLEWPANSPDLNPIENIWNDIKFMIRKANTLPRTKDELKSLILQFWEGFPAARCQKLISSMSRRCESVIKSKGYPTKY